MDTTSASDPIRLLVVIVNYRTSDLTLACLNSLEPEIRQLTGARVVVVDSASGDGPKLQKIVGERGWQEWAGIEVAAQNRGFAAGNNVAIRLALNSATPPQFVMLLNPDTEIRPGAVRTLLDFMDANPKVGIAGSGIENPDGTDWPLAFRFMTPGTELISGLRLGFIDRLFPNYVVARRMEQDRPAPVDWVSGCSLVIRREVFEAIGLLDESYFLYFEEVDFCLRAQKAGWPCWYVPRSRVMHIGGQSTGLTADSSPKGPAARVPRYWFESRRRYFAKNYGRGQSIVADLGFGLGYTFWRLRRRLQGKPDGDPVHFLADFWRDVGSSLVRMKAS